MVKKQTKWHEDFFIGATFIATSIFLFFNGFSYLISLFIIDGEIIGGPTKQKGIAAFASSVEQSFWKYPLILIFVVIAFIEIKKGYFKLLKVRKTTKESKINMYEKTVVEGIKNLSKLGFRIISSEDRGMHKCVSISNDNITFDFTYDRGYVVCHAIIGTKKFVDLISLANFKYYDNKTYKPLSKKTITHENEAVYYYARIIEKELLFLTDFILHYSPEKLEEFEDWSSQKSIEQWIKVYRDKRKPVPDSLKNRIKK